MLAAGVVDKFECWSIALMLPLFELLRQRLRLAQSEWLQQDWSF